MFRAYFVLATCLGVAGIGHGQTVNHVLKIHYTSTSSFERAGNTAAVTTTSKTVYLAPDGTTRTEILDNQRHTTLVVLSNEAQDYQIDIDEQAHTATRVNGLFHAAHSGKLMASTKDSLGTSSISGYSCQGYLNSFPNGVTMKRWVCTDPGTGQTFTGRTETTNGASTTQETIVKVSSGVSVPSTMFQVPPGYTTQVNSAAN